VRNGICCRKAIPTTKRYIGFRLGEPNPRPRKYHIRNFLGFVQLACLVIALQAILSSRTPQATSRNPAPL
jgi:hypothetical protein